MTGGRGSQAHIRWRRRVGDRGCSQPVTSGRRQDRIRRARGARSWMSARSSFQSRSSWLTSSPRSGQPTGRTAGSVPGSSLSRSCSSWAAVRCCATELATVISPGRRGPMPRRGRSPSACGTATTAAGPPAPGSGCGRPRDWYSLMSARRCHIRDVRIAVDAVRIHDSDHRADRGYRSHHGHYPSFHRCTSACDAAAAAAARHPPAR